MAYVYVYVMDTMADWEVSYAMAELNSRRFFRKDAPEFIVRTVSYSREAVRSMGGLTIVPDLTLDEVAATQENMLILPGSNQWNAPEHTAVLEKAKDFLQNGGAVAAICGATVALAGTGVLDERPHTSNGKGFLEMFCPAYRGEKFYVDAPAVRDGNLITASATGGLLMAKYILEYFSVFRENTLENWYSYFTTGKAEYFFAMMQSLQA
ncbi:MAG: glutamine amidotransferase [Fretibacterium sp.]|nr:glutamine amidotransferase [Fretibacterium sp.]